MLRDCLRFLASCLVAGCTHETLLAPDATAVTIDGAPVDGDVDGDVDAQAVEFDVKVYTLQIAIDPEAETYTASVSLALEVTSTGTGTGSDLTLDLAEAVEVDDVAGFAFSRSGDALVISGEWVLGETDVTIAYHGSLNALARFTPSTCPSEFGGLMLTENRYGDPIVNSYNWPYYARRWIPSHDHPSDGAALDLTVTLDSAFEVVGNGVLVSAEPSDDGRTTWHWSEPNEMPTYDIHLAAFPYADHDLGMAGDVPVTAHLYPEDSDLVTPLEVAIPAMAFLEENIGDYAWERYALVAAPICGGAMEEATAVSMDEFLLDDDDVGVTVVHELVHHWIGNVVRIASWNDFWISEGFAMNLTGLFLLEAYGEEEHASYLSQSWDWAHDTEAFPSWDHPLRPADPEVDVYEIFDSISYDKANWVLHSLRLHIGDEAFWAGVIEFYEAHTSAAATTEDLQAAFETAAGEDLDWFFDSFVYAEYHPVLAATSSVDGKGVFRVNISQVQERGLLLYEIPIEFDVFFETGEPTRYTTWLVSNPTSIEIGGLGPTRLVLDPDEKLYADIECESDEDCPDGRTCSDTCRR